MSSLAEQLQILHECGFSSDDASLYEAEKQVKEIEQTCSRRLTKQELGLYCSLLFHKDGGILPIISKNVAKPQHKNVREGILTFLSTFVSRIVSYVRPYVSDIHGCCNVVYRSDRFAKNKIKALKVLAELIAKRSIAGSFEEEQIKGLVKMLFEEIATTKCTSTVKGQSFHMLGTLARYYPEFMTNHSERLFDIFLRGLRKEMITSNKASDLNLIEGYLLGLHALLFSFTASYDEVPVTRCKEIFKFARMSLQPQNELSRFAVPLAGMKLLKDHAAQFGPLLVESYESYYNVLNSWFEHKNPQLKHEAHAALDSFLQQVASTIADEKGASSTSKQLFMFFIRKFKLMINSSDTSSKVMSLAVRGYGLFAGACRLFLSKSDVRHMFSEMMSKCEQMFLSGEEGIDDNKIHQLPSFIQSLANITQQLEMDDDDLGSSQGLLESFMSSLCRLCVLLVEKYPRLHRKYYFFCHSCILSAVHAFDGRPDVRDAFLERITYHGLIRSCSYGVVLGEERSKNEERGSSLAPPSGVEGDDIIDDVINDSRTITYKDYVSLWSSLMSENRWSESTDFVDRSNLSVNRKELCQTFTSIFIKSVLKIVTKLNLSASNTKDQNDDSIPNPGLLENLQAENADDFKFFINIVDLCWDLLPNVMLPGSPAAKAFSLHFQITLQQLVALSTRFPLVSGFYKLLATIVKISCKLNYFCVTKSAESFLESQGDSQESMDVTESDKMMNLFARDRQETLVLLQKFAIEVVSRQKQHKDDLLASSLFFLLSLPANAAAGIISHLTPAVQRVAVLGLSYFPLASALISALERWKEDYIKNPTELEQVIISLQPFLASEQGSDSVVLEKVKLNKKSKSSIKKQKNIKEAEESTRKRMRSRVVRYLGSLGGSVLSFLKKPDEGNEVAVADWDKDIVIKYAVPFRDLKPEIRLDLYLPRVMEIASQSSDRQAKIAACELMHSIVLYTIGTNAQTSNMKSVSGLMPSLYKKLFPVLLRLACDVDQVCKQMFEPLMKQIIHWFTNNQQFESPSTATLLNALMDSLVDFDNAALRELSAQLLCEFLAWSVKQNTVNTSSSPTNAKSILKRIYSLARHPSSAKRLGATVAFNHLYRVFREQATLVDDYTLEILVTFIDCLALSHDDDSSLGTESSCVQSLKHIERIVKAKFKILNKPSNNRRIPKGFNPIQPVTLVHVVEWLFDQCGRPQTECRHQCMRLFYDFVKLIPDDKLRSATLWIAKKKEKDGTQYFVKKFESGNGGNGIQTYTFLSLVCSKFSVKSACNWFDLVLAALEAYSWLFQEKLLTPVEVLCENRSASFLFRSLRYFICDVAQMGIEDLASKFAKSKSQVFVFTPQDTQTYNQNKCSLISRTLQFIAMLLQRFPDTVMKVIPDDFWTRETLLSLICTTTVCPSTLGFDTLNDENVVENLRMLSTKIVSLLLKHLPMDKKLLFVKLMAEKLTEFGNLIDLLPIPFNEEGPEKSLPIQDLIRGYAILSECKMLDEIITNESQENFDVAMIRNRIFESVFGSVVSKGDDLQLNPVTLAPKDVEIGNVLLQLALKLGLDSETLVSRLYDNTGLISYRENKLRNTHGQMFAAVYSKKICEAIVSNPSSYIPAIIDTSSSNLTTCTNILISTLEYLTTDRIARKKYSASVCGEILNSWSKLKCFWHDDSSLKDENSQSNALDILRRIFALDAKVCTEPNHPAFEAVFEMYKYMLTSAKLNLSFKLQALDLLSFFTLASDHNDQLKSSLENFVANHFPLSSRELSPGSTSHNEYCSAIKKILLCLEMTGNLMILQIVISIFCREEHHCLFDEVQNTFHVCVKSIPIHQQKSALDLPFHNFITSRSPVTRRHAVCDVIVPMATRCDVVSLVEFFSAHLNEVMDILKEDTKRYPESQWIDQLERKSLAYRILELMFSLLPKEQIEPSSSIGQAYASSQNKESLMKAFMMRANRDRNENLEGESQLLEERRKFHCSVYNAMIASVVCTQTEQKWYKAFLFDENPSKNQFFLNNVIPTESKYKFEVEMTEPLVKRKRFVAIRKAKKEENNENEGMMFAPYMASIAGSSLSEEVSAFDGNRGRTVQISSLQTDTLGFKSTSTRESPTNFSHQNNFVELEANSLNEHECMPAMVGVITHMQHNKIGLPAGDAPPGQLPQWMLSIHKKFASSSTHPNIRIFIAKLIVNCEECFRPYAKYWIAPLIQTIVRGDCCVDGIDWMACDVLATALSWNSVAIPEDTVEGRGLVQGLLEHLAEKFSCDNRALLRHNLDLIKATLECWGSRVKSGINPKLIYDLCGSTDPESKSNFAGLQLLGALLANAISPYTSSYVVDRSAYFKRIFQNIVYKRKEIYDSAAEVGGMTLRYLTEIEKETEGEIHEMVVAKLTLLNRDPKWQDVFITSLHKVASHYPPIVDQFLSRVMFLIPKVHGDLLTYCFEIILERADSIEELFTQLKAKNFTSKLSIGNEALQLVCLRLCRSVISNKSSDVTNDDVMMFFGQIAKHFPQHASVLCRQEAANVAMEIYDAQMSLPSDKRSSEILSSSRLFLLKLLHDPEEALRNQIVNFWSSEDRLPIQASAKLGSLLGQMYDSALDEVNYLSNTVSLLLQSASLSPDFERPMFDHPLSECVFQEYTIDNRWRYRHASMTPLFADTLQAGGSSGDSPNKLLSPPSSRQPNVVMATQENLQFSATVDMTGKNTYNWMTGSSLDTFSSLAAFGQPERKSALLVGSSASGGRYRPALSTLKPTDPDFGKKKMVYTGTDNFGSRKGTGVDVNVERLRRRFRKESDESRMKFARAQERRNKIKEVAKTEAARRRETEVQLHRKYRTGELPDVQIPHRSIVAPLAAACQHDPHLCRIVLSSLILALLEEETKIGKKLSKERIDAVLSGLGSILDRSTEKNPALIGCIQDVCYHDNRVEELLPPALVASSSLASNKHALGIVILEQMILNKRTDEPATKRRKVPGPGFESCPETWLQLARLYKSLGDFDVLSGIFGAGSNPTSSRGLSLEIQNSYKEARKVYEQALNDEDTDASDVERDMWEDCLLNCVKQMSRWDHVNFLCDSLLERYDNVTSDDVNAGGLKAALLHQDYQGRFLESAVHAKLLLLLQGRVEVGEQLSSFFDDVMQSDVDRKSHVERRYSEHLTMLYIYKDDFDRARYYLNLTAEHATQRLSSVGGGAGRKGEQEIFRVVPLISDLHEFLDFAQSPDDDVTENDVRRIVGGWMTRMPHLTYDPITSWHDVISYRTFLMDQMSDRLGRIFDDSEDRRDSWLSGCRSKMLIEMMRSAFTRGNFVVAEKILRALEKDYESLKENARINLSQATASFYHARGRRLVVTGEEQSCLKYYLAAFRALQEQTPELGSVESIRHNMLLAATYHMTSQSLEQRHLDDAIMEEIRVMAGNDEGDLQQILINNAFGVFEKAVKESEKYGEELQYEAYTNLASFCDKQLQRSEENSSTGEDPAARKPAQYAVTMTTCFLRAMRLHGGGRSIATLRFPRLLQLLEEFGDEMKSGFVQESQSVPSWNFLPWLGHMVALLDGDVATFLHPIMTQVSRDYPQAVVYPLCAAQQGFCYKRSDTGKKNKSFVKKLLTSLHEAIPLAKEFIRQLQQVSDPVVLFKDWFNEFSKLHKSKKEKTATNKDLLVSYQNMYRELFDHDRPPDDVTEQGSASLFGSVTSQSPVNVGALRTKFAKDFKADVDGLFGGSSGSALLQMRDFKREAGALCEKISKKFQSRAKTLRDYSPWLADFQSLQRGDKDLEIPGQYDGRARPLVEYHVTVVGFDERVQVMSSLRRPCRVIIRGSDEREHSFLVKGGEDLRQDQRIEQIFVSINDIFNDNSACRDRNFSIVTYQVIPINAKVGLIEWVPNVVPYLELMTKQAAKMGCESTMSELSRSSWVPANISQVARNRTEEYGLLMHKGTYTDVVDLFNRRQNKLPWNMLREVYFRMSADPESFLNLRKRFISSYGVMCIVHWLLGIGDRHPSNFMVSMTTGRTVGIDFGHAFGSATEVLPVPELVPFRMTKQLIGLLLPHAVKRGEMRQVMVHCLSALRSRSDELSPLLDVFVKDPSVDWTNFAKKSRATELQESGDDITDVTSDRTWYARRKMKIVERKLSGGNPAAITCDEVEHNADVKRFRKDYCSVAMGDSSHGNVRAQLDSDNLSVDEQVDSLLDLATDPNVLGRCWQGWKSWL
uniref:DNA-dependent protein kinase catalytic subunit n=1 Tax=Phallusia mammillata TaxID=59560 RepID=A0A6F9DA63_9ASCI|nr:DNA-dependent protein kinase catalytic subunit-like [Phallusia mammillata]